MVPMARAGPDRSREPGASSSSPSWVAGPQVLGLYSITFLKLLARSHVGIEVAGAQTKAEVEFWHWQLNLLCQNCGAYCVL